MESAFHDMLHAMETQSASNTTDNQVPQEPTLKPGTPLTADSSDSEKSELELELAFHTAVPLQLTHRPAERQALREESPEMEDLIDIAMAEAEVNLVDLDVQTNVRPIVDESQELIESAEADGQTEEQPVDIMGIERSARTCGGSLELINLSDAETETNTANDEEQQLRSPIVHIASQDLLQTQLAETQVIDFTRPQGNDNENGSEGEEYETASSTADHDEGESKEELAPPKQNYWDTEFNTQVYTPQLMTSSSVTTTIKRSTMTEPSQELLDDIEEEEGDEPTTLVHLQEEKTQVMPRPIIIGAESQELVDDEELMMAMQANRRPGEIPSQRGVLDHMPNMSYSGNAMTPLMLDPSHDSTILENDETSMEVQPDAQQQQQQEEHDEKSFAIVTQTGTSSKIPASGRVASSPRTTLPPPSHTLRASSVTSLPATVMLVPADLSQIEHGTQQPLQDGELEQVRAVIPDLSQMDLDHHGLEQEQEEERVVMPTLGITSLTSGTVIGPSLVRVPNVPPNSMHDPMDVHVDIDGSMVEEGDTTETVVLVEETPPGRQQLAIRSSRKRRRVTTWSGRGSQDEPSLMSRKVCGHVVVDEEEPKKRWLFDEAIRVFAGGRYIGNHEAW